MRRWHSGFMAIWLLLLILTLSCGKDRTTGPGDGTGSSMGNPDDIEGLIFVTIPGGTFRMGDEVGDLESDNRPVHTVTVSTFEMSVCEVTNAQYAYYLNEAYSSGVISADSTEVLGTSGDWSGQRYIQLSGYLHSNGGMYPESDCKIVYANGSFSVKSGYEHWPALYVTWYGSKAFAEYYGLDLAYEAEWEYACRGGKQYLYGTADGTIRPGSANFYDRHDAHPVDAGSYPANPFGLYDMSGNVMEWCNDWLGLYSAASIGNPTGAQTGDDRVRRGGCWHLYQSSCRSACRLWDSPHYGDPWTGFRVVRRSPGWVGDVEVDDGGVPEISGPHDFDGMDFVPIPGGTSRMGDIQGVGESDELPVHDVTLSAFEMSVCEVTNAQYVKFLNEAFLSGDIAVSVHFVTGTTGDWFGMDYLNIGENGCHIQYINDSFSVKATKDDFPVQSVTWFGAKAFAEYYGFDLPIEAEWEYACRAGTETMFHTGNDLSSDGKTSTDLERAGWYKSNNFISGYLPFTHPVGQKEPNQWGLYDMHGNVREWCGDWYGSDNYSSSPSSDPAGAQTGSSRVIRGGSWQSDADECRSSVRYSNSPNFSNTVLGFRVVRR